MTATSSFSERFNGHAWTAVDTPTLPGIDALNAVSCTAPTFCIAVGETVAGNPAVSTSLVEQYDGHVWSVMPNSPLANPAGYASSQGSALDGVSCVSPTFCAAVGVQGASEQSEILILGMYDGSSWTAAEHVEVNGSSGGQPAGVMSAIACSSATSCTAVGSTPDFSSSGAPISGELLAQSLHYDGHVWSLDSHALYKSVTPFYNALLGVSCAGQTPCVAVGYAKNGTDEEPFAGSYSGSGHWSSELDLGAASAIPLGISCLTGSSCVIVGVEALGQGTTPFAGMLSSATYSPFALPRIGDGVLLSVSCLAGPWCVAVGDRTPTSSSFAPLVEAYR